MFWTFSSQTITLVQRYYNVNLWIEKLGIKQTLFTIVICVIFMRLGVMWVQIMHVVLILVFIPTGQCIFFMKTQCNVTNIKNGVQSVM